MSWAFTYTQKEINDFINGDHDHQDKLRHKLKWRGMFVKDNEVGRNDSQGAFKPVIPLEKQTRFLLDYYNDPLTGFIGRDKLYNKIKQNAVGVTKDSISQFLKQNETHQVHQDLHKQRVVKPIVVKKPGAHWQLDLVDYENMKTYNQGYAYIFSMVDLHSKYLFMTALKNKTSSTVAQALTKVLDELDKHSIQPSVIQQDNGGEFKAEVSQILNRRGIKQVFSTSHTPQSQGLVERVQGHVKQLLARYMTANNTRRWFNVLDKIVTNYNSNVQRITKQTPHDALFTRDADKSKEVYDRIRAKAQKTIDATGRVQPKLAVGDFVRVSRIATDANERKLDLQGQRKPKSAVNYTKELYKVVHIRKINTASVNPMHQYKLETHDGKPISKWFNRNQLLKTVSGENVIKSEKIDRDIHTIEEEKPIHHTLDVDAAIEKAHGQPIADRVKTAGRVRRAPDRFTF